MSLKTTFALAVASLFLGSAAFAKCDKGYVAYQGNDHICIDGTGRGAWPMLMADCDPTTRQLAETLMENISAQSTANSGQDKIRAGMLSQMKLEFYNVCPPNDEQAAQLFQLYLNRR